jgi:sortase A
MKITKLLALTIILSGAFLLGIGFWQLWTIEKQEELSLNEAREFVSEERFKDMEGKFEPVNGEVSGLLEIPKINAELAIVEGTDPNDLEKGVGHYQGSFYPDENGQIVLSGHRDTVFRRAGELELGDILTVIMPYGNYHYEIVETRIVSADDTSIITLQDSEEELILTTCYPFSYIGDAPDRYIMYAKKVTDKD